MNKSPDSLAHLWLPYTQMKTSPLPLKVVDASGCTLHLEDGRKLVDGIASWWTACHGYCHPHIEEAVAHQLQTLPHVMLGGLVHTPAIELSRRLVAIAPSGLNRVFFSDSGSVAVEVALKMALQYWLNKRQPGRNRFVCFRNGYHGDTTGAMSVSDPDAMHRAFRSYATKQYVLDIPSDEYGFGELDALLEGVHKHIAAMIIEPLLQGAGGMKFHSPDVLAELHRLSKKYNILFIADEIATGFGRTGTMFACQQADITPDIMCVGKALTGGTMTLAATLATEEVFEAFYSDEQEHAFMHGPTFMANPLACAAALASLELFEREPRLRQVELIEEQLHAELVPLKYLSAVADVRVRGAVGVMQLLPEKMDKIRLRQRFIEEGVWLRPLGDVIYITPPFVISSQELSQLTEAIAKIVGEIS